MEKVAELVGEDLAIQAPSLTSDRNQLRQRQQKFENWAGIAGLGTFGLILLLLIVLVFSQMILKGGFLIVPGTFLILLAVGAGAMVAFQMYSKSLKAKLDEKPLPAATPTPLSNGARSNPPWSPDSVSEGTTKLLESAARRETGEINQPPQ